MQQYSEFLARVEYLDRYKGFTDLQAYKYVTCYT